jgi:hypothetical protein
MPAAFLRLNFRNDDCCAVESTIHWLSMRLIDLLQWPAMLITVAASWCVASRSAARRQLGFWVFLASNVLWTLWGIGAGAYALVVLQVCLAITNVRGQRRNADPRGEPDRLPER